MTTQFQSPCETILTGATGFLGHYLLAELLRSQCSSFGPSQCSGPNSDSNPNPNPNSDQCLCTVLLRAPVGASQARMEGLLDALGVDAKAKTSAGLLKWVEGGLPEPLPRVSVSPDARLIHVAAATNFQPNAAGDPHRTNVEGTAALLAWASEQGIRNVHLVSSAYSCGRVSDPVDEVFNPNPPEFHNAYERSKWEMERLAVEWGKSGNRRVTIHRPSIIVGAFETGRATRFGGFYFSARATELVERMHRNCSPHERQGIALQICGRPGDCQNIVPVDYVASMIAAVVCNESLHGRTYHWVNPEPPSNLRIKQAFESHFGIAGGRFVSLEAFDPDGLSDVERAFFDASQSIRHYFVDTPVFNREHAANVERVLKRTCPRFDSAALARLVRYGQSARWGKKTPALRNDGALLPTYFRTFLPPSVRESQIARMASMTATVRFMIEDARDGDWICRFDKGLVVDVQPGADGLAVDFGYRTVRDVFWEYVSGRLNPQDSFLDGRAEVFGDVERALKMATVLHTFAREFPCDPDTLANLGQETCLKP